MIQTRCRLNCAQDGQIAKYDLVLDQWCADDDNSPIDEPTVEGYITNGAIDLSSGSTVNGSAIVTEPSGCTDGQVMLYNLQRHHELVEPIETPLLVPMKFRRWLKRSGLALQANDRRGSPVLTEPVRLPSLLDGSGNHRSSSYHRWFNGVLERFVGGSGDLISCKFGTQWRNDMRVTISLPFQITIRGNTSVRQNSEIHIRYIVIDLQAMVIWVRCR